MRHAGVFLLIVLLAPSASAHATLQSATPPPNGHADVGLDVVEFVFTEDVEREYTGADVLDQQGNSHANGSVVFDEARHNVISLRVTPLGDGLYSASWKALSVDTHTTRGSFVFAVGNASLRPGQYTPIVDEHSDAEVNRDGFARFAFYLGLFLVVGMPLFALVVLREPEPPRSLFRTAAVFGAVAAAGAFVGLLFLGERTGLGLGAAAATAPGRSFVARGALVGAAAIASAVAVIAPARWRMASIAAIALGATAIVATATGSHAAAVKGDPTPLIAADAVHLLMGAIWIGGVVSFLHIGWGRSAAELVVAIDRFSPVAIASVLALLGTGFFASLAHMPCASDLPWGCLDDLRTERYVQLVALKLALMAPLVALGALHKFHVSPRLRDPTGSPRTFRRLIQVEALVMATVLGAAGVLAATAPPGVEVEQGEVILPYVEMQNTTKLSHVIVQVSPNPVTVGIQKVVVIVHPLSARLPNGTLVALKVWHEGEEEPETTIDPTKVTPNEWEIEDALLTSPGTWNMMVLLQRTDEFAKIPFQVQVQSP